MKLLGKDTCKILTQILLRRIQLLNLKFYVR